MRCDRCNANLEIFGSSPEDLPQCPLCGAAFTAVEHKGAEARAGKESSLSEDAPLPDDTDGPAGEESPSEGEGREEGRDPFGGELLLEGEQPREAESVHTFGKEPPEPAVNGHDETPAISADGEQEERSSFFGDLFAVWLFFTGAFGLITLFSTLTAEFVLQRSSPLVFRNIFLVAAGLILTLAGAAATKPGGTVRSAGAVLISRRVLGLCMVAAGGLVFFDANIGYHRLMVGETVFGVGHLLAVAAVIISLLAVAGRGWALRSVAVTASVLVLAGLKTGLSRSSLQGLAAAAVEAFPGGGGWGAMLLPAAIAAGVLGTILQYIRGGSDGERTLKGRFFSYFWPGVAIAAAASAVFYGIYDETAGMLHLYRNISLASLVAGAVTLLSSGIVFSWRTGRAFSEDLLSAANSAWGWVFGLGVSLPLLWFAAGGVVFDLAMATVGVCTAMLLWVGWVLGRGWRDVQDCFARWLAAAFLIAGLVLLAGITVFTGGDLPVFRAGAALVLLPFNAVRALVLVVLFLIGMGNLRRAYQYDRSNILEDTGTVCRLGMVAGLVVFTTCVAYVGGAPELRDAMARLIASWSESVQESVLFAAGAWPVELPGAEAFWEFVLPFLQPSPAALIMPALIVAGIYWAAQKKIGAVRYIAGSITFLALIITGLLVLLFIPVVFGRATVAAQHASGMPGRFVFGIVLWGVLLAAVLRFALVLPAFFKRCGGGDKVSGAAGSYRRMLQFGMVFWVVILFLTGSVAFGWDESRLLFQAGRLVRHWSQGWTALAGAISEGWYGYGIAVLTSAFVMLAIHVESLRGAKTSRACLAAIWTFVTLLSWFLLAGFGYRLLVERPVPGQRGLLAVLVVFVVLLTGKLIGAWRDSLSAEPEARQGEGEFPGFGTGGTAVLGRIGVAGISTAVVAGALWWLMEGTGTEVAAPAGEGMRIISQAIGTLAAGARAKMQGVPGGVVLMRALWVLSLLMLVLFYVSQFTGRRAALHCSAIFSLVVVAGLVFWGIILGTGAAGAFSPGVAWLFAGYCVALLAASAVSVGSWLMLSKAEQAKPHIS